MKKQLIFLLTSFVFAWWAATASAAEVTLTWNPVPDCDYVLHYGNASGQYQEEIQVTGTSTTLSLIPGVYYFALTSHIIDCNYTACLSEYSDEVSLLLGDKPLIVTIGLGR